MCLYIFDWTEIHQIFALAFWKTPQIHSEGLTELIFCTDTMKQADF